MRRRRSSVFEHGQAPDALGRARLRAGQAAAVAQRAARRLPEQQLAVGAEAGHRGRGRYAADRHHARGVRARDPAHLRARAPLGMP